MLRRTHTRPSIKSIGQTVSVEGTSPIERLKEKTAASNNNNNKNNTYLIHIYHNSRTIVMKEDYRMIIIDYVRCVLPTY